MRNFIIGTAGHIDHGKTALVKALTGHNTDTLAEEIKRGITINLGFTYFALPDGSRAGIIDVPGHERFVRNMIAGASGVDLALLAVASNEGVKPQTLEHIDILSSLGICDGIIVLTKSALSDEIMLELVTDEISEAVKGTFLEKAEIMAVDSISGQGIDELKDLIARKAKTVRAKNSGAPARLNVDRVFSKKGFGTIVTGTLLEGKVSVGDELTLYPSEDVLKVRNLQVHETNVPTAWAGQRAAINLAGAKTADLKRGDVLAEAGSIEETVLVDVKLCLSKNTERSVKFWDRLRICAGTKEILCRCVPLSVETLSAGEEAFCQLRLEEPLYCKRGDRFIVRFYSPVETLGGGAVIDPKPKKHAKMDESLFDALNIKESGGSRDVVEDYIKNNTEKYIGIKDIQAYASLDADETRRILEELCADGIITEINGSYFHFALLEDLKMDSAQALAAFHSKNSLKKGMQKETHRSEVLKRTKAPIKPREFDALIKIMEDERIVRTVGSGFLALYAFEPMFTKEQERIRGEMEKSLLDAGFAAPAVADLTKNSKKYAEVLDAMIPETAVFLDKQTVLHRRFYDDARAAIIAFLTEKGEITLAEFRDLIQTSRKFAQLIIESFDNARLTTRVGDKRVLARGADGGETER